MGEGVSFSGSVQLNAGAPCAQGKVTKRGTTTHFYISSTSGTGRKRRGLTPVESTGLIASHAILKRTATVCSPALLEVSELSMV